MGIEETIYGILSADATLLGLSTGIAARIKPPGNWQALARPYIIYKPVTFNPTYVHDGGTLIDQYPNFQINVVADSYSSARAVANAVKLAVIGTANGNHGGTQFFLRNEVALDFDTDRKLAEIALDYELFQ